MRPLFIGSKPASNTRYGWWVLVLALLGGGVLTAVEMPWMAVVRDQLQLWEDEWSASMQAQATAAPASVPMAAEALPQASVVASASEAVLAAAQPAPDEDIDGQVQSFVERWAASWSAKNLDGYFAAYADNFQSESHKNMADWAKERKQRIVAKNKIAVQIKDFVIVSSDHSGLKTSFTQTYEADGFRSVSAKVLLLNRQEGAWKIVREYTL